MKNKTFRCTVFLILIFLCSAVASAEFEIIYFDYGVEMKRQESKTWEFIQQNEEDEELILLQETDLLRIPPDVSIRVKNKGLGKVEIPPGQEGFVIELMKRATGPKQKLQNAIKPKIRQRYETDIDVTQTKVERTIHQEPSGILDIKELRALAVIDDNSLLQQVLVGIKEPSTTDYPYTNLGYARTLFNKLCKEIKLPEMKRDYEKLQPPKVTWETKKGSEVDVAILYCALLRKLEIPADFKKGKDGSILVCIDSGYTRTSINRITVNPMLYETVNEEDKVHLPIKFLPSNNNFIFSWYEGGKATFKQSRK